MTGFECPSCKTPRLQITSAIELPPDFWSDEITLQTLRCAGCSFAGLAVYQESRRGALDSEPFVHRGYPRPASDVRNIEQLIGQCPEPSRRSCACAGHKLLGRRHDGGWSEVLGDLPPAESFSLKSTK